MSEQRESQQELIASFFQGWLSTYEGSRWTLHEAAGRLLDALHTEGWSLVRPNRVTLLREYPAAAPSTTTNEGTEQ